MRVLFVCTANISRSRAAEEVFRVLAWSAAGRAGHEARSAGIDVEGPGRQLSEADLEWADVVCVMEPAHEAFIAARWPAAAPKVRVLGIPDVYGPEDLHLRDLLAQQIRELLAEA